jgi:predicted amidohydrolase YtcJ
VDVVISNATIYTANGAQPWADTMVVRGDRVAFVGRREDWPSDATDDERDVAGALVMPSFVDSHTHPTMVSKSSWHVRLPWTHDVAELVEFIRDYANSHSPQDAPFLYFEYYPTAMFSDSGGPTKELLDSAVSDRPVLVQDFSEHAHWVNSQMLELMGVNRETPDPVPGLEMFVRDANGEPTGHLYEMVYEHFLDDMYAKLRWHPPEQLTAESVRPFFDFMNDHGVTAVFEAWLADEDALKAMAELEKDGQLHCFIEAAPRFWSLKDLPEAIETLQRYQAKYGSERIRVRTLKLFLDGTNESGNSALLAPLMSEPSGTDRGSIQMDVGELTECLLMCNDADVDVHIHLVGDRSFRVACDAVEAAQSAMTRQRGEWRIQVTLAHCELVDRADMTRPAQLGIFVNWSTHWSGGYFGEQSRMHLGDERWNRMYAFNEIADAGGQVTFSSDVVTNYELQRGNPFFGMQVAATRIDPEYPLDPERYPDSVRPDTSSRLSLERLVQGYTIVGACQLRIDDRVGSLEVGKLANFMVLSENLFTVDLDKISQVNPVAVVFEGEVIRGQL